MKECDEELGILVNKYAKICKKVVDDHHAKADTSYTIEYQAKLASVNKDFYSQLKKFTNTPKIVEETNKYFSKAENETDNFVFRNWCDVASEYPSKKYFKHFFYLLDLAKGNNNLWYIVESLDSLPSEMIKPLIPQLIELLRKKSTIWTQSVTEGVIDIVVKNQEYNQDSYILSEGIHSKNPVVREYSEYWKVIFEDED